MAEFFTELILEIISVPLEPGLDKLWKKTDKFYSRFVRVIVKLAFGMLLFAIVLGLFVLTECIVSGDWF